MRSVWRRAAFVVVVAIGPAACAGAETQVATETPDATGVTGATGATGGTEPQPLPTPITGNVLHGERYFGVYLAAAPFDAPELEAAVEQLAGYGVEAFPGSIGCDQGAAEQLGVSPDLAVVAIYFERRPDATAWVDALDPPPLGIAMVRTYCAD
jgi:hypothetical protein